MVTAKVRIGTRTLVTAFKKQRTWGQVAIKYTSNKNSSSLDRIELNISVSIFTTIVSKLMILD